MKNIITIVLLFAVTVSYGQTATKNYVKETTRTFASTSNIFPLGNEHIITTTYYDGLGRPIQIVDQNSSPDDNKNIVTHIEYEKNIGQVKEYLPFTSTGHTTSGEPFPMTTFHSGFVNDAQSQTFSFYNTSKYQNTVNPYSENRKEHSPRQRVLETGFPGVAWEINPTVPENDRNTIRSSYLLNTFNEVKRYTVITTFANGIYKNSIAVNGNYPANTLTKTVVKNENWKTTNGVNNTIEEFKDPNGNVVLKRTYNDGVSHDTYYVYNDLDLLAFVIPPMANGKVATADLDQWCYQYNYDAKKRLVEKKLPQKDWEYIIYDKADRVVMTGPVYNPFGDNTKGWLITKYDNMERVAYTGFYTASTFTSAARHSLSQNNFVAESKTASNNTVDGITVQYTNTSFPTTFKLLTVNYYDNYNYPGAPTAFPVIENQTVNTAVKGQPTGTWARVLTTASSTAGNLSYNLYDNKYQVIRAYSQNHLGGYTQTSSKLTFTGVPTKTVTIQKQNSSAAVLTITDNFTYDHRDRLTQQTQQLNGATAQLIAENTYDELGVLVSKKVGNTSAMPLQDIGYSYNIRGWLTRINTLEYLGFGSGREKFGLFNYVILYNNTLRGDISQPQFNGNIANVAWRTQTDNVIRGYSYDYDHLNRLNYASHLKAVGSLIKNYNRDGQYAEDLAYDKNGNITTLKRYGQEELGQPIELDDLTYTYTANQLQTVTDATNNTEGFNDVNKTGADYVYDSFGNLTQDKNKGITQIKYNHLNLPTEISFASGKINYTYDATGTKLKKVVTPTGGVAETTDYLFGFEYENSVLSTFPHAEGYVKNNANNYVYHYIYKDHLGNNRLVYADLNNNGTIEPATEIIEENNYYPFGLKHKGYNEIAGNGYKYKFNGKEYEDALGLNIYEMDLRQYDPAIGRWVVQDPVIHHDFSPYSAFDNNPVFWSDPSGADATGILDKEGNLVGGSFTGQDAIDAFNLLAGFSAAEKLEVTVQEIMVIDTAPDGDEGGGGDGNGGGDQRPKNNSSYRNYNDWYQKVLQHKFLNNFTFEDAIYHYNFGKGEAVTVNLNRLNFDGITVERFLSSEKRYQDHPSITVNFLGADYKGLRKEQGLIYGNITLVYIGNNTIMALPDQYNFEMHKGNIMTKRNILTFMGSLYNGAGTPYYIYFQGTAKIKTK